MNQELFGMCKPEFLEAPTSWLCRGAASQGLSFKELCAWLGVGNRNDVDSNFASGDVQKIAGRCGFPLSSFDLVKRILCVGTSLQLQEEVLLRAEKIPRYRFCPLCLRDQATPNFPVHWRFNPWRMCYTHECLMEDRCPHCRAPVLLQSPMDDGGPQGRGIAFLSQCSCCGDLLWKTTPVFVESLPPNRLSMLDAARLRNGCAFVSAVAFGRMSSPFFKTPSVDQGLQLMERFGLIAGAEFPTAEEFRKPSEFFVLERENRYRRAQ